MRVIEGKSSDFNRACIEGKRCDILLSPEKHSSGSSIRHLDSGLNGIMARLAAKNKVRIGIDIADLRALEGRELGIRLAKIAQNIVFARKAGCLLAFTGQIDELNARALLHCLGASSQQVSKAISF